MAHIYAQILPWEEVSDRGAILRYQREAGDQIALHPFVGNRKRPLMRPAAGLSGEPWYSWDSRAINSCASVL